MSSSATGAVLCVVEGFAGEIQGDSDVMFVVVFSVGKMFADGIKISLLGDFAGDFAGSAMSMRGSWCF